MADFSRQFLDETITLIKELDSKDIESVAVGLAGVRERGGRLFILGEMNKTISVSNADLKPHAPRAYTLHIEKDQIGAVIGPGGKVVQDIQKTSGATVVIEEVDNKGVVNVFANNQESMDMALRRIRGIVAVPEVGTIYDGKVKTITPFGAFIEFLPGKDGLLHISQIRKMHGGKRIENLEDVMKVGDKVNVEIGEIDPKGKLSLVPVLEESASE